MKKKLGLALGGGGARGLAHIGILKVMERINIVPDIISGTSMGGIIGAAYACGMELDQLEKTTIELTRMRNLIQIVHLRQPIKGLIDPVKLKKMLASIIPEDISFEQLKIPLAVCATDLNSGKAVGLHQGNLLTAVMASCALPGVFPPVCIGDNYLVDGGVLNNLPVDLAYRLGSELVVAVDVQQRMEHHSFWQYEPLKPKLPQPLSESFYDMMRSETIMSARITEINLQTFPPDLYIEVPVSKEISTLSGYHRADEIIRVGEKAAEKYLEAIQDLIK